MPLLSASTVFAPGRKPPKAEVIQLFDQIQNLSASFLTKADAEGYEPGTAPGWLRVVFYDTDYLSGAQATYRKVASEPSHSLKLQIAEGSWYEIAETVLTPEMAGGGVSKSASANVTALNAVLALKRSVHLPNVGTYQINAPLTRVVLSSGEAIKISAAPGAVLEYTGNAAASTGFGVMVVGGATPYFEDTMTTLPVITDFPEPLQGDAVNYAAPVVTFASAHGLATGDVFMLSAIKLRRVFGTVTGTLAAGQSLTDASANQYTVVDVVDSDHLIIRKEGSAPDITSYPTTLTAVDGDTIAVTHCGGTANAERVSYDMGEIFRVLSAPTSTTVVIDRAPVDDYRDMAEYMVSYLMPMPTVELEGLYIRDNGSASHITTLCVTACFAFLTNVKAHGSYAHALQTVHTLDAELHACEVVLTCPSTGRPADNYGAGNQYGFHNTAGLGTKVFGGRYHGTRHGVDSGGSHCFAQVEFFGAHISADNVYGAAGLHGNNRDTRFVSCDIHGGAAISGRRSSYIDCDIKGVPTWDTIFVTEISDWNHKVTGCRLRTRGAAHDVNALRGLFLSYVEGYDKLLDRGDFLFEDNELWLDTDGSTSEVAAALVSFDLGNSLRKKPSRISLGGTKCFGTSPTNGFYFDAGSSGFGALDIGNLFSEIGGVFVTGSGAFESFTAKGFDLKALIDNARGTGITIEAAVAAIIDISGHVRAAALAALNITADANSDIFIRSGTLYNYGQGTVGANDNNKSAIAINSFRTAVVLDNVFRSSAASSPKGMRSTSASGLLIHKNIQLTGGSNDLGGFSGTNTAY